MAEYRRMVDDFGRCFTGLEVHHIKRDDNKAVDALARLGSQQSPVPPDVSLKHLHKPSIKDDKEGQASTEQATTVLLVPSDMFSRHLHRPIVQGGDEDFPLAAECAAVFLENLDWITPYLNFLLRKELPKDDEVLSRQIEHRSKAYIIINVQLYKRSTSDIFQRCISPEEGRQILEEIHSGECGHQLAPKALVAKAFRLGFFWLSAKQDAARIVKICEGCQRYA